MTIKYQREEEEEEEEDPSIVIKKKKRGMWGNLENSFRDPKRFTT